MDDHLLGWLTTLDEDRLTRILANRPDAIAAPWPRRLEALAERLTDPRAVLEVMRTLPLPPLELLQACLVIGDRATEDELARFLGVSRSAVQPWLEQVYDHALAWPGPDGRIHLADAVARMWTAPYGLGDPLAVYLETWTLNLEELRRISRRLGLSAQGGKRQLIARIRGVLEDPDRLHALLAEAPDGTLGLLDDFAWDGPVRTVDGDRFAVEGTPERWAADRALLFRTRWDLAEMPREVALALRGPDYHAPFTPQPPEVATVRVDLAEVEEAMCRAAPRAVERAAALLENTDKTPLPLLRTGGVGVREVRRVARETGGTEAETRLLLEVCAVARLLAVDETAGGLVPTERFDAWRLEDAPARLRVLLAAWWRMERSSLLRRQDGRYPTPLGDEPSGETVARIRWAVLSTLAALPEGATFATLPELVQAVHWRAPLLDRTLLARCCPAVLEEGRLLGVIAGDAVTPLGRALARLSGVAGSEQDEHVPEVEHDPGLIERSTKALASAQRTAQFGADLTAVVTGPPSAELAALLDRAADRESRGSAAVWRFSPASVRRALDAGHTADGLIADLSQVGTLPRTLTRLIRDVARRHGEVTVTTVACIIQGSDPALLAEIATHRRLARLGLRQLAPTVLASSVPAERTLAALREAGYSPVPVDDTGEITVRREPAGGGKLILLPGGRVAELESTPIPIADPPPDPREHARRLLRARAREEPQGRTWAVIGRLATRLPTAQQSLLGSVVDRGTRAMITLTDGITATISHGELRRNVLEAWCEEAGDYLEFPLSEISSVTAAY